MSNSFDNAVEELEGQLEGAERTLSGLGHLSSQQADRVAQRMDRLSSQLLEVSEPPPIAEVHERLGTSPAEADDFAGLTNQMGPADGEG